MTIYFGLAMSDSMFSGDVTVSRKKITVDLLREITETRAIESCVNSSHGATIEAMGQRFGITVPIPEKPPKVELKGGDTLLILGVRGLPRLTDRHEYSTEEIEQATWSFSMWSVH